MLQNASAVALLFLIHDEHEGRGQHLYVLENLEGEHQSLPWSLAS